MAGAKADTDVIKNVMSGVMYRDLDTFVNGGKPFFPIPWNMSFVPYQQATDIAQQYVHQPMDADEQYKNKIAFIHAVFVSSKNGVGDTYRVQFQSFVGIVDKSQAMFLANATSGTPMNITCVLTGKDVDGFVHGTDCRDAEKVEIDMVNGIMSRASSDPKSNMGELRKFAEAVLKLPGVSDVCASNYQDPRCMSEIQSVMQKVQSHMQQKN